MYVCGNVYDCGGMVGAVLLYVAMKRKEQREIRQHAESRQEVLSR